MFEGGMSVRDERAALRSDSVGGETISGKVTGRLIGSREREVSRKVIREEKGERRRGRNDQLSNDSV